MSDRAGECSVVQLGRLDYGEANELQERALGGGQHNVFTMPEDGAGYTDMDGIEHR